MDHFSREKRSYRGLGKWILVVACGLLTALLITAGIYFRMDTDSTGTIGHEQKGTVAVEKRSSGEIQTPTLKMT